MQVSSEHSQKRASNSRSAEPDKLSQEEEENRRLRFFLRWAVGHEPVPAELLERIRQMIHE